VQSALSARWGLQLDAADVVAGQLRPEVPRGFDTAARRAEAAAVEAAAAAEFAAATAAAARSAAPPVAPRAAPAPVAVPAPPAPSGGLPLGLDPSGSDQVITVVAASSRSTSARLTAWQRGPSGWAAVLGPVTARIGASGVGRPSETTARTPAGTFSLTEAFGRAGDPGTALPYRAVDGDDWWVSDVHSPRYNQYAECAPTTCDFDEGVSENLLAAGAAYDHAVVIDYNRAGTPGAGSAYFLHVSTGAPTAGCVAVDAGSLVTILRWLDPGSHPLIAIGVA
jgi:L,D-peptidoglycan transpeptidase YkuD (ErfK/YbiS/YcfS/YnhG family)